MTVDFRLVLKAHGNGSRFEVEAAVQNVSGSTLLRHELHATDTSVASENARCAGRARLARQSPNSIGQSGYLVHVACLVGQTARAAGTTRSQHERSARLIRLLRLRNELVGGGQGLGAVRHLESRFQ